MNLYPTPTRLALLREVDAGNVCDGSPNLDETSLIETYLIDSDPPHDARKVTARIEELEKAGWVEQPTDPAARGPYGWALTDLGRFVLDAAGQAPALRGDGLPADEPIPTGCRFRLGDQVAWHVYPGTIAPSNPTGFVGEVVGGFLGQGVVVNGYGYTGFVLRVLDDRGVMHYISSEVLVPADAPHCVDPDGVACVCCVHAPVQLGLFAELVPA